MVAAVSPISGPSPTPFCDRRFKCIRLVADCIAKIYLSIFYTAIFYLAYPFSRRVSLQAKEWSHIYSAQGARILTYLKYGNQIIDFSFNFSPRMEKKTMEEAFGKGEIEKWSQNAAPFGHLMKERLTPKECREGCCAGMTLDLISTYLKEVRKGNTPASAIRLASSRASEGASKEAELAQIFGDALERSSIDAESIKEACAPISEQSKELLAELEEEALSGLSVEEIEKIGEQILLFPSRRNCSKSDYTLRE